MTLKLQLTKRNEKNKEGRNFISAAAADLTDFSSLITEYGMKINDELPPTKQRLYKCFVRAA